MSPATTIKLPDGSTIGLRDWVDDKLYDTVDFDLTEYRPILKPWVHERWAVRATCEIIWEAAERCFVSGAARHNVSNVLHNLRCWTVDLHSGHLRVAARHARRLTGNPVFDATRILAREMHNHRNYQSTLRKCSNAVRYIVPEIAEMIPRVVGIVDDYRVLDLSDGVKMRNEDVRWAALALLDVDKLTEAHRLVQDYLAGGGK